MAQEIPARHWVQALRFALVNKLADIANEIAEHFTHEISRDRQVFPGPGGKDFAIGTDDFRFRFEQLVLAVCCHGPDHFDFLARRDCVAVSDRHFRRIGKLSDADAAGPNHCFIQHCRNQSAVHRGSEPGVLGQESES